MLYPPKGTKRLSFFTTHCDCCGAPMCERTLLLSLAAGFDEEARCLHCISEGMHAPLESVLATLTRYVQRRSCFKKPWDAFDASACPATPCCSKTFP